ncbi:MAG: TetR family transcriptional regulator [Parvibaculum sp.]|nr:TetR family transcriptional regulator [Parvibaculum sp.]|tara:strand:+ start:1110 stop:1751 length:642 start_codon:yes stop_codon:yes gene_type:complete
MSAASASSKRTSVRKIPTQARAKERFERILDAARCLIEENGSEHMKMSDVATRAGVPIGSVYQYFPDKSSIIITLAERIMELVHDGLATAMGEVTSLEDGEEALTSTLMSYYQLFLAEPVARDIWFGIQADKTLNTLDIEDSRANGEIVYETLKNFTPKKDRKRLETACFLVMQLTGMAVRLAISVDRKEGDRIMAIYQDMIRRELIAVTRED